MAPVARDIVSPIFIRSTGEYRTIFAESG